jgi:hypothetical protein
MGFFSKIGDFFKGNASSLIGGAATLGSAYMSSKFAEKGQEDANDMNYRIFREGIDWQKEQAQNRVQWYANDLQKAGFNRILAVGGQPPSISSPASAAPMQSTKRDAVAFQIAAAKAVSEIILNKQKSRTEESQQKLLDANTDRAKGTVSIPGVYSGPVKVLKQALNQGAHRNAFSAKSAGRVFRYVIGQLKYKPIKMSPKVKNYSVPPSRYY